MAKTPIEMITIERERQKHVEGWTTAHDDAQKNGEMARAAACYASPTADVLVQQENDFGHRRLVSIWPWSGEWDKRKKHHRVKCLVIAGALIVAELERLQRAEAKDNGQG